MKRKVIVKKKKGGADLEALGQKVKRGGAVRQLKRVRSSQWSQHRSPEAKVQ